MKNRIVSRLADTRGAIGLMAAILAPVLVIGLALSLDTAYWRFRQSVLQSSADTSAQSASFDLLSIIKVANHGNPIDANTTYPLYYGAKTFTSGANLQAFLNSTATFD